MKKGTDRLQNVFFFTGENEMKKICVVTGTRAEYGHLQRLMQAIKDDRDLQLQLIVTGAHLSPEFGLTYQAIEKDGFKIDEKIEMLLSSDSGTGVTKSVGLATIGFADAYARLQPNLLVMLGDRFELLAAAQAALFARIPIAHIGGGDITEGALDDSIRHSITKMSHLHFVISADGEKRVRQLGENPAHIFNFGSPSIDQIKNLKLLGRAAVEKELDFQFRKKNLLITFHPATLDPKPSAEAFAELLDALADLGTDTGLIFTRPNADPEGRKLTQMLEAFVAEHPNAKSFASLGQLRYLSTAAQVDAVVGNSSSGLVEIPSLGRPTVNIGDRQKGRTMALSVINCPAEKKKIVAGIKKAFTMDCAKAGNPYGDGKSSPRILKKIKELPDWRKLLVKTFFDL